MRRAAPDTEFDIRGLAVLPRVDIAYSYAGNDGAATRGFVAAGAKGIVAAAFAPGLLAPAEMEAMVEAVKAGVTVVVSSRAGSGRVFPGSRIVAAGLIPADNLNPQKARVLLSLALTRTRDPAEIRRMFATY
jgi:L-asparaginase